MARYLETNNLGHNVWMWKPIHATQPDSQSRDCNFGGHSITRADGSLRPAALDLQKIYAPTISFSSINPYQSDYAISITGNNLFGSITAKLVIDGTLFKQNIPLAVGSTFSSFVVTKDSLTKLCPDLDCIMELSVSDINNNFSQKYTVTGTKPHSPPQINNAGIGPWQTDHAIWITGDHLRGVLKADLYLNNELVITKSNMTVGQDFSSMVVPNSVISSKCARYQCNIEVSVTNYANQTSNRYRIQVAK
jgi:hypothetical protein